MGACVWECVHGFARARARACVRASPSGPAAAYASLASCGNDAIALSNQTARTSGRTGATTRRTQSSAATKTAHAKTLNHYVDTQLLEILAKKACWVGDRRCKRLIGDAHSSKKLGDWRRLARLGVRTHGAKLKEFDVVEWTVRQ
eukprot:3253405-Pleurochrysis_carterae.AAC.1